MLLNGIPGTGQSQTTKNHPVQNFRGAKVEEGTLFRTMPEALQTVSVGVCFFY